MKQYSIYFNDFPSSPLKVMAKNKTEARKMGNLYNRQWRLRTSISRIEEKE